MAEARPKLVRDGVPDLIRAQGDEPVIHVADPAGYRAALADKLREEVSEWLATGDVEELVDILEVVYAIAADRGVSGSSLDRLRHAKRNERGGFNDRIIWEGNR